MIEKYGDLFDTDAPYVCHGVNTVGVMGAGIAKTFRDKFPKNHMLYKRACDNGELRPGGYLVIPEKWDNGYRLIVNLASQEKPGPDATYEWLLDSLLSFVKQVVEPNRLRIYGGRIALPEIGCGIGGLEWPEVKKILEAIELAYPNITFEVWHYEG